MSEIKMVPGDHYYVSDESEEKALKSERKRFYIGHDSIGRLFFEDSRIEGVHPCAWKYAAVIPSTAIGHVDYTVHVECPNCSREIDLNAGEYADEESEFSLSEDLLGKALFGTPKEPPQWDNLKIKYRCAYCRQPFELNSFSI